MEEIDYIAVGKRIRIARKNLNLTQEKLAEAIEVVPSYISEIERGVSICSLSVIVKIAHVLNQNLDNLVCGINISNADTTFKELLNIVLKENHKLFIDLCTNIAKTLSDNK